MSQQQQQTTASPGPPRFYQQFKKPHESPNPAPAASPIVTLSDFSFNPRPSFTSTRSETIDASTARPQTLLHPSLPNSNSSTGSLHTRNLTLPVTRPKTRSEPSQPRPQLSLILPSDASTLGLPTSTYQGTATSSSHLRSASYTAGQSATPQVTEGLIERSPTPYARPIIPGVPTPDLNFRSRSRSSSISISTTSNDRLQNQASSRKPPPVPPRPRRSVANTSKLMQKQAPQSISNLPDPLRSHPPSPLSPDQNRSRSYSQPTEPPPRPPKIPYRNSDPYTRGQGRPPIPAGLSPEATPIAPTQSVGISRSEQSQRHARSYSSGSVGEAVPKPAAVMRRPVYRGAASEPMPSMSNEGLSSTLEQSSSSPKAPVQAPQVLPSSAPSTSPLPQSQFTTETTEPSRRRSSPLSNVSTPPSRDSVVSACTSTQPETCQSCGSTSSEISTLLDTNKPFSSMPTTLNDASISELSLSERIRQPRLSLNSLRNLSLLARSSKSNLHSNGQGQSGSQSQSQYQSPLPSSSPLSFGSPDSQTRSPSTAASSTSSSSQHSKKYSQSQGQGQGQSRSTMSSPPPPQPQTQPQSQSQPQPQPQLQQHTSNITTSTSNPPPHLSSGTQATSNNPSTPLLTLTTHIQTQLNLATSLFTTFSPILSWTERTWMQGTISDTERAISAVHFLTESLRVEEETNGGKIGLGSRVRWKLRDGKKAKERREDLVLVGGSLGRVIERLQGVQGNFPQGLGIGTGQAQGQSQGGEANDIAIIAEAASKELSPAATYTSLPASKSTPRLPTTNIIEAGTGSTTPPVSVGKPPSPPWDLMIQRQDPGMELFVDGGMLDTQSMNSSMVQFELCDTEAEGTGTTPNGDGNGTGSVDASPNSPPPPAVSPPPPPPSTKLDEELLDMLNWRWNRGRVSATQ